jgi:PTS system ascorbate-specific IIA component
MKVGILIVTHEGLGDALVNTICGTLGHCPLETEVMSVSRDCDPEAMRREARERTERLDHGDGVLVLTDMFGSTPSNIACSLLERRDVQVLAGLNLPMLIRIFNYPDLPLDALTDKALSGGHDGVVQCRPNVDSAHG